MRKTMLILPGVFALSFAALAHPPAAIPAYVTTAIHDPARQADAANDARRRLAAVMTFTEVKPGDKVMELVPGSGYWTRVFSAIVGSRGHVYSVWPNEMAKFSAKSYAEWQTLVATPHYANVSLLPQPAADLSTPEPVDVVFTSQNYHDYHDPFMGPVNMPAFDKRVYAVLKPGGLFVIVDHVAPAGSGISDTNTLHRIDPAVVKREVEAAGFVFDGESEALRNPADPHTASVFDKSIRGHTDQFIYRFRKPRS
ncbi:MAG: class I SAM-dependent methyltransferase [Gammaproteobacteria bacterium]|nr:class I SAM-dependent methyltransferase [Gammaproteobacteria bacterium]MDE2070278.1 class I SAM-dependent methyltransferase [Gammaproteobacteria bacterium]